MNQSPTLTKLSQAFVAAQAEIGHAPKDSLNPHFKSKYADLATVIDTIRPVLAKHKLSVLQRCQPSDRGVTVQTVLLHESGEWVADDGLHVPAVKNDPQAFGSALTYTRRYGLAALLGIAQDDDDANTATAATRTNTTQTKPSTHAWPFGDKRGTPLADMPTKDLEWLATKYEVKPGKYEQQSRDLQTAAQKLLKERTNA